MARQGGSAWDRTNKQEAPVPFADAFALANGEIWAVGNGVARYDGAHQPR